MNEVSTTVYLPSCGLTIVLAHVVALHPVTNEGDEAFVKLVTGDKFPITIVEYDTIVDALNRKSDLVSAVNHLARAIFDHKELLRARLH